jgi:hypothetical protein
MERHALPLCSNVNAAADDGGLGETRPSANVKGGNQPVKVGSLLDETRSATESNCVTVR